MKQRWQIPVSLLFPIAVVLMALIAVPLPAKTAETDKILDELHVYTDLIKIVHERYGIEISYEDLVDSAIVGMLHTLDPHTTFLTPEAFAGMRAKQQVSFFGIGALVSVRDGQLTVISPVDGGPAARLGVQAGDVISTIDGLPTDKMTLDEAIQKLKGVKGTQVKITILRRGLSEPLLLTVTRAEIPQTTVRQAYMMTPETGYILITEFSRGTGREVADALRKLKAQGMKQILIDLRNNGGGLLDQGIAVAEQFLPEGSLIVETRGRVRDALQSYKAGNKSPHLDLPVVVLVNEGTASASEIVSGAIQDHDRGIVAGTPTWGKGLVQTVYNLSYGAGLALTTSKYYTPSGRLIQRDFSSYYDYYLHKDAGSPEVLGKEVDPGDIFETDLGRKVYGGGGITPDVLVNNSELSPFVSFLFSRNAYLTFGIDYTNRNKQQIQSIDWQPGAEIVQEFRDWVVAEEITTAEEIDTAMVSEEVRSFITLQLRGEIMNNVFGQEARHRALASGDEQIQGALGLFERAATLQAQRMTMGKPYPRKSAPPEPQPRPALTLLTPGAAHSGSYEVQFGLAKLLMQEGAIKEALAAFEEAERLAPDAPYVRIEHAQLLDRLGNSARAADKRKFFLQQASEKIEAARKLAPENLDVLRAAGEIYFDLSNIEPAAREKAISTLEKVRSKDPASEPALLQLAQLYMDSKPELAVEVLRDLVSRVPHQRMANGLLIQALLASKQESEAEAALVNFLALDPTSVEGRITLADLQSRRGEHEASVATLRAAPDEVAGDPRIRSKLGWGLYDIGDLESALSTADKMLAGTGEDAAEVGSMRLLKARVLIAEGRNGEALQILKTLSESNPDSLAYPITIASILQREGKIQEATQMLSQLAAQLASHGKTTDEQSVRMEMAQLQLQAKDYAGVQASVAPLLAATDEQVRLDAVLLKAEALLQAKLYDNALVALQAGGKSPRAETLRAQILFRSGKENEARAVVDALASGGETLAAAQTWQRLERYSESIPLLEKVVAAQPESTAAWYLLGAAHERTGQQQKAIAALRKALEIQPDFHAALNYLGYIFATAGENLDEALRMVQRAVALDPQNGAYVDSLGFTYYRLGRFKEAHNYLERALRLDSSDATVYEHLGDVLGALHQYNQAREAYKQAVEMGGDNQEAVRRKLTELPQLQE